MAADLSALGDLVLQIGGDISPLQDALDTVPAAASAAAAEVDQALAAQPGVDALTTQIQSMAAAMQDDLATAASDATEALDSVQPAAADAAAGAEQASAATQDLGAKLDAIIGLLGDMSTSLQQLSTAEEQVAEQSEESAGALENMSETATMMREAAEAFIAVAFAEHLAEIADEAVEAYGEMERLTTAFTVLGGSSEQAKEAVEDLQQMAVQLGIPLEQLEQTAQRASVFFGTGEGLTGALEAAANASAATGQSIGTVVDALSRVEATGQVMQRSIMQLGISWQDLATSMGVSVAQAQQAMAKGGQSAEQDVADVIAAINAKLGTAAEAQSQTILGQFTSVKNQITLLMENLGSAIAPSLQPLVDFLTHTVIPAVNDVINVFKSMPPSLQSVIVVGGALVVALIPLTAGLAALGFAIQGIATLTETLPAIFGRFSASLETTTVAETEATAATERLAAAEGELAESGAAAEAGGSGLVGILGALAVPLLSAGAAILATKQNIDDLKQSYANLDARLQQHGIELQKVTAQEKEEWASLGAGIVVLGQITPAMQVIVDTHNKAVQAYQQAKQTYDLMVAAYQAGKVPIQDVTLAQQAMNKAWQDANPAMESTIDGLTALTQQAQTAANEMQQAQRVYQQAMQAFRDGAASMAVVNAAWDQYAQKAKAAGVTLNDVDHQIETVTASAASQITKLQDAATTYERLKELAPDTVAGQLAIADALKALEAQAKSLGLTVTTLGDGLQFGLADKAQAAGTAVSGLKDQMNDLYGATDLDYVTINGKLVPTIQSLTDSAGTAAHQMNSAVTVLEDVAGAADDADSSITILRGSVTQAAESIGDLDDHMVYSNGVMQSATDFLQQVADAYDQVAQAANQAAQAVTAEADAQDTANTAASTGARGGHGGDSLTSYLEAALATPSGILSNATGADQARLAQLIANMTGSPVSGANFGTIIPQPTAAQIAAGQTMWNGSTYVAPADLTSGTTSSSTDPVAAAQAAAQATWDQADAAKNAAAQTTALSTSLTSASSASASAADTISQAATAVSSALTGVTGTAEALGMATQAASAAVASVADSAAVAATSMPAFASSLVNLNAALTGSSSAASGSVSMPGFAASHPWEPAAQAALLAELAAGTQAPTVSMPVTVQAGTVVGQNGMTQLANTVAQTITTTLRQVTGLKLVGS